MFRKRIESFGYAFKGLATLFSSQPNARIHAVALAVAVSFGFYFKIEKTEWLAITLIAALVLSAEAMNTAVEFVVDLVSPDYHPLAGKAKDVAAAAVLLAAFGAIIVGLIIFLPKIADLI
ncbi:MAG: diacylglycerol kinase family protein [Saprospiraceae bacterium]|nr:diacylglycerol kinase family protein [Saprospiraceae bacterium]